MKSVLCNETRNIMDFCLSILYLMSFTFLSIKNVRAIDCFKCISMNHDYQPCEDPFHNNHTLDIFESPCMGGRRGRDGIFPATSCVKITGTFDDNEETIMIRGCALDSGTLTTDTELVRMSHCGGFYYDNRYVHGCVQTCNDADACNGSRKSEGQLVDYIIAFFLLIIMQERTSSKFR